MLRNTIANLEIGNKFLNIPSAANDSTTYCTGLVYLSRISGVFRMVLILAGWNNQITATILDEISKQ